MTRTNELSKLLLSALTPIIPNTYRGMAENDSLYPHAVFNVRRLSLSDKTRTVYQIDLDVYDKERTRLEENCDLIEDALDFALKPNEELYTAFYVESRIPVKEEDKTIEHRLIVVNAFVYERKKT